VTRGGRFLEAPVIGSKQLAKDGQLVVIAAGDKSLYDDCQSCLQAMARHMFYLGEFAQSLYARSYAANLNLRLLYNCQLFSFFLFFFVIILGNYFCIWNCIQVFFTFDYPVFWV